MEPTNGQDVTQVRLKEPRITPIGEEQQTEQQQKFLAPSKKTGSGLNLFSALMRHPLLFERWMAFCVYVLLEQSLPPRDREMLILRIGWGIYPKEIKIAAKKVPVFKAGKGLKDAVK